MWKPCSKIAFMTLDKKMKCHRLQGELRQFLRKLFYRTADLEGLLGAIWPTGNRLHMGILLVVNKLIFNQNLILCYAGQ